MTLESHQRSLQEIEDLLFDDGLERSPDDELQIWYRPDAAGVPQPEITEYGTIGEAVRRLLSESRAEAAMAWADVATLRSRIAGADEVVRVAREVMHGRGHSGELLRAISVYEGLPDA